MADVDEVKQLTLDTQAALLNAIKDTAGTKHSASGLQSLANAYALAVGAAFGVLPGQPPTSR